jgi:hypothetical protein
MTAQSWSTAPYTVHVNGDPSASARAADAAGARVLTWSLAGIRNREELDESATVVFAFPFRSVSLDGLVDMLSDLDWLGVEHGVLLIVEAADASSSIVQDVASILPDICDRWRSGSSQFEAYLNGVRDTATVAARLEESNASLDRAGRVPWSRHDIARVPVVIHS